MKFKYLPTLLFATLIFAIGATAQTRRDSPEEPIPESIREKLVEMQISEQKKDHDKLLERSELVAKLCEEIESSFTKNEQLTKDDRKKLKQVDRLLKKIRRELKASKTDRNEKIPATTFQAVERLKTNTSKLLAAVKKTTRHTVSVVAIQSSNTVLSLVRFLRLRKQ